MVASLPTIHHDTCKIIVLLPFIDLPVFQAQYSSEVVSCPLSLGRLLTGLALGTLNKQILTSFQHYFDAHTSRSYVPEMRSTCATAGKSLTGC